MSLFLHFLIIVFSFKLSLGLLNFSAKVRLTFLYIKKHGVVQILFSQFSVKELSVKKTSNKFNTIDPSFLNFSVPVFWERNERRVKVGKGSKVYKVNGVMHMDGNILLSDLERVLPDHVLGKLKLNYTGAVPFDHPDEHELCQNILKNAKAAFEVIYKFYRKRVVVKNRNLLIGTP